MSENGSSDPSTQQPSPSSSIPEALSKQVGAFLEMAQRRGYATLEELSQILPEAEEDVSLLDEVFTFLERHDIPFYEDASEVEGAGPESEAPASEELLETGLLGDISADDTISIYLHEMAREPLLSRQEEVELAQCIEQGDRAADQLAVGEPAPEERHALAAQVEAADEARARFIRANTRLVVSIAKKYVNHGVPFLDLIQEGNLGLIRAVEKFDYRRGHRFSTYATWWIRQAISRALADQGRTIRIPIHMSDRIRKIQEAAQRLEKRWGRRPTPDEIAELVEIAPSEISWILSSAQQPISLEQPVGEEQDNELGHLIEDEELPAPPDAAARLLLAEEMDKVLATLDPREERILRLRYGLVDGRNYTLEEVGDRFGLTRERIRQIEGQALRKLRHPRRSRSLRDYLA